jgi:hypothetical protein
MATLAKSFVFDRLSFFIAECASPKKKVAILSTSCEEIAFFGESARVYRAIVTVHTVGKGPLCEIPHLNKQKYTFISLLVETETIWVPSGWTENELTEE